MSEVIRPEPIDERNLPTDVPGARRLRRQDRLRRGRGPHAISQGQGQTRRLQRVGSGGGRGPGPAGPATLRADGARRGRSRLRDAEPRRAQHRTHRRAAPRLRRARPRLDGHAQLCLRHAGAGLRGPQHRPRPGGSRARRGDGVDEPRPDPVQRPDGQLAGRVEQGPVSAGQAATVPETPAGPLQAGHRADEGPHRPHGRPEHGTDLRADLAPFRDRPGSHGSLCRPQPCPAGGRDRARSHGRGGARLRRRRRSARDGRRPAPRLHPGEAGHLAPVFRPQGRTGHGRQQLPDYRRGGPADSGQCRSGGPSRPGGARPHHGRRVGRAGPRPDGPGARPCEHADSRAARLRARRRGLLGDQRGLCGPGAGVPGRVAGGAIAIGHPVGASGARIVLHALKELARSDRQRAIATLCIGGGQGGAMLLERGEESDR
jgi:hypothetical protein